MKLLTAKQLAEQLQIHPKTVYRLAREGKIELIRIGRSVRFIEPTEERMVRDGKRDVK